MLKIIIKDKFKISQIFFLNYKNFKNSKKLLKSKLIIFFKIKSKVETNRFLRSLNPNSHQ